jgi:hypothetical protein
VIEIYSAAKLTRTTQDRLVALSGIVEEFSKAIQNLNGTVSRDNHLSHTCICGIWLDDITQGLLWQRSNPGTHERVSSIPSWSWASIYTKVRWGHHSVLWNREWWLHTTARCSVMNVLHPPCSNIQSIDNPSFTNKITESNKPDSPHHQVSTASIHMELTNVFPVLCISGKITPVIINSMFISDTERDKITSLTHHRQNFAENSTAYGENTWRMVSSPSQPDIITGWANLEHPSFQEDGLIVRPTVYALIVSQISGIFGGIKLGYLSCYHHAYNVLFLRQCDHVIDGYERIGVGRLVGREIDRDIGMSEERTIRLL